MFNDESHDAAPDPPSAAAHASQAAPRWAAPAAADTDEPEGSRHTHGPRRGHGHDEAHLMLVPINRHAAEGTPIAGDSGAVK